MLSPVREVNNLTCFLVTYLCFSRYECHAAVCQPMYVIYIYIYIYCRKQNLFLSRGTYMLAQAKPQNVIFFNFMW